MASFNEYSKKITVSRFVKLLGKEEVSKEHPIQRNCGQWDRMQKSNLICTLLKGRLLDPIRIVSSMVDENGENLNQEPFIVDGLQRSSTIEEFVTNQFMLSRNLKNGTIEVSGKKYDIAKDLRGKNFEKLDEELQDAITNYNLTIYYIENATDEQVKEEFINQNSAKPLTNTQKSTADLPSAILDWTKKLGKHEFWSKTAMSKSQLNKDEQRYVLLLTLSLFDGCIYDKYSIQNLIARYVNGDLAELSDEDVNAKLKSVNTAINKLNEIITEKQTTMKKTNVPFVIYGMMRVLKNHGSTTKYGEWLQQFFETYDDNEEFKKFVGRGTTSADSVKGRKEYFDNAIKDM